MSEFKVVDTPANVRPSLHGRHASMYEAIMALKPGKSLFVPESHTNAHNLGCLMAIARKRQKGFPKCSVTKAEGGSLVTPHAKAK